MRRVFAPDFLLELAYRPPYAWDAQLDFLARRAVLGVRVAASLAKALPQLLGRGKRLFDLGCRPEEVGAALGSLAAPCPGLRVPGAFDGFETAVRAVLGQQITVRAARTLAGRVAERFGVPVATAFAEVTCAFPAPRVLAAGDDGLCGAYFVGQKQLPRLDAHWRRGESELLARPRRELEEYFAGRRQRFSLPLTPRGTPFQRRVWQVLEQLAYGSTVSYGELARRLGAPGAARAVGAAGEIRGRILPLFVVGALNSALPFCPFAYAVLSVRAGFASILNTTAPLGGRPGGLPVAG